MKTLYLECAMGASGDMLMGALVSLLDAPEEFIAEMNALGVPGVQVRMEPSAKCGVTGTHVSVTVNGEDEESRDVHGHEHDEHEHHHEHEHDHVHEHHHDHPHDHAHDHTHASLAGIQAIVDGLPVSEKVRQNAMAVYRRIAAAESEVHGHPVDQIHFHEVGAMDAVADVVGVCLLMERLAPEHVVVSPVSTGFGQVRCAHGILPVPAPATALLLRGVPCRPGNVEGELCTPTGAALLAHFADEFGPAPTMAAEKIGYGMGKKDFPAANCLRAFWGESARVLPRVAELKCNLDDMTPEAIGFAVGALLDAGALDAFTESIYMKKNRPAVLLTCLCAEADAEKFARLMLAHTTTLGVRKSVQERYTLVSHTETARTPWGEVRMKRSEGFGLSKCKPEYDDAAAIARENRIPLAEVLRQISEE